MALSLVWSLPALAASQNANKITRAEIKICKSVKHCVDITNRHGPDAFDYALLQSEFLRFGDKGQSALFKMISGENEIVLRRAQNILARGGPKLNTTLQNQVADIWPRGDIHAHAKIMRANLSPLIQSRVIDTLNHKDEKIRDVSRDILKAAKHPLNDADFSKVSKAAITEPTPALISLLSGERHEKAMPVLTRILRSGDAPSVIASYESLFAQDPKTAFQTLVGILYDLKEDEGQAAFALAALLRHRHKNRTDGFYLKFAKDIAEDSKMGAMGRVAGFDAVMRSSNNADIILANSPIMIDNLGLALETLKSPPRTYVSNYPLHAETKRADWAKVIWKTLKSDPYKDPDIAEAFFNSLGQIPPAEVQNIVSDALNDQRDYGMIKLGLITAVAQTDKSRLGQLKKLTQHPITNIRSYARLGIAALSKGDRAISDKMAATQIKMANNSAKVCQSRPINFKTDVKQLPFFDLENVAVQTKPYRTHVSSVMPTRKGWLVGYAAGEWGGDLQYYDNKTGRANPIMYPLGWSEAAHRLHQNITAILPIMPQRPGQYSSEFWAFITDGGFTNHSAVYRLSQHGEGFQLTRHAQLPSRRLNLSQETNGDIFISFYDKDADQNYSAHPPLILSKTGSLRRACNGPALDPLKALP